MLNADQWHIYDIVLSTVNASDFNVYVSRIGGTSKSFLVEALKALVGSGR